MPIETLDGTPGKEEQVTAQDPAPQTAHDLPASRPKASPESVMANPFARFLGGPPLAVIVRLILLSILVGVVLHAAGLDPWNIIDSLQRFVLGIWDLGFDALRWLWRYFLLGAVLVVPIWLVVRLARAPSERS
jgi:hypothetical protein